MENDLDSDFHFKIEGLKIDNNTDEYREILLKQFNIKEIKFASP